MPVPQSASVAHAFGWQLMETIGSTALASAGQSVPLHVGGADVPDATQANPCGQAASAAQVCADPLDAASPSSRKVAINDSRAPVVFVIDSVQQHTACHRDAPARRPHRPGPASDF